MRYALDDVYAATHQARPAEGAAGWVGVEVALAEVIGAPRYAAGHLDIIGDFYLALVQELSAAFRARDRASAAAEYLDRVARSAEARGGGQRALAYLHESLTGLGRGLDTTLASAVSLSVAESGTAGFDACPALDAVAGRIVQALRSGVPAYNAGDPTTCARVYRQAAEQILADLRADAACGAVSQRLRAALSEAAPLDDNGAAWALRRAFDELLAVAARRRQASA
jgi:hypothetical protein